MEGRAGPTSPPTCPPRRPIAWPWTRRTPTRSMWPRTRACTSPPRWQTARRRYRIAGRCLAPDCPAPRWSRSAPLRPPLPRRCWWRPPTGAASGKPRCGARARDSPPRPQTPLRSTFPSQVFDTTSNRADGNSRKHRQHRSRAHVDFHERQLQRDRQLRECSPLPRERAAPSR